MRFTIAAVFAFASAVLAQSTTDGFDVISKPTKDEKVPAGTTYSIVWDPIASYDGTVSISLLGGATPATLQNLGVIAGMSVWNNQVSPMRWVLTQQYRQCREQRGHVRLGSG
jgi:hypothetical protein